MNKKIRSKYKKLMLKKIHQEIQELHQKEIDLETKMVLLLNDKFSKVIKDYHPIINLISYSTDLGTVTEEL